MKTNQVPPSSIYFRSQAYQEINAFLDEKNFSSIFVLVDENTQQYCLSYFLQKLSTKLRIEIIEIEAGETHKNPETCTGIWKALSELGADRKSLMINLGGGIITDLGGFVATLFKRGIHFIHVPTTLLAMVDAAIGGKNGANLDYLKNQIGTVRFPALVAIDPFYLETLPQNQLKSGLAEMLKHGLIYSKDYWNKMSDLSKFTFEELETLIRESISIKSEIVASDPNEKGTRKILNFGHTLGHAIESYFLSNPQKTTLLHGEAIAIGMIMEAYISSVTINFSIKSLDEIKQVILHNFNKIEFIETDLEPILQLLQHDKKSSHGKINFALLKEIGRPEIDCPVDKKVILESFEYYSR